MELYKIVRQLTSAEFEELHDGFTNNKADKSALFLKIIRQFPENPDKEFLIQVDITPAAFYVLKSRLNQKVEEFLLTRLGDPNLDVISRVLKAQELAYNNSRQITVGALNKLERELVRLDFPYGLTVVYKLMQQLHCFNDEDLSFYQKQYNKQMAYTVAMDKATDLLTRFFRLFDSYWHSRKEEDLTQIARVVEQIDNLCHLYDSHRLYIYKSIIHLYVILFLDMEDEVRCELEKADVIFEKAMEILNVYKEDKTYEHIHMVFNFLRYIHFERTNQDKLRIYFDILDFKVEELLTVFYLNANTALFLAAKIRHHVRNNTTAGLMKDVDLHLSNISLDMYRPSFYIQYHFFLAETAFLNGDYNKSNKVLYSLRNTLSFRKYPHSDLETKFLLAIGYIMTQEDELTSQTIMSIQRQLRNETSNKYEHCKTLLKILTVASGNRANTRIRNFEKYIPEWEELNTGKYAMLTEINMRNIFLTDFFN